MKISIEKYFRFLGYCFIAILFSEIAINFLFIMKSELTNGVVISHRIDFVRVSKSNQIQPRKIYCPVVKFYDLNNVEVNFESDICGDFSTFKLKENVGVYYNPEQPHQAKINSFRHQFGRKIVETIFLSIVFFGAFPIFRLYKKYYDK